MKNPFSFAGTQKADDEKFSVSDASFKIEIFQAGKRTAQNGETVEISIADLKNVAENYDISKHEAPIVVGHPTTDAPAYGWVKSLSVEGNSLFSEIAEVSPEFQDWVKKGHYKKISCSFWTPDAAGNPTPNSFALKHVGFLGGAVPAVKGMRQATFAALSSGVVSFVSAELEDENKVASLTAKIRQMEATSFVEKAINDGRVLPIFKEGIVSFMEAIGQSGEIAFAEGNGKRSINAVDWFKEYVEKQPKVVTFGAINIGEAPLIENQLGEMQLPAGYSVDREAAENFSKIKAHAKAKNISFAEAVKDVSRQ